MFSKTMPLTKRQKEQLVEEETKRLQESETVLLTDFTGLPVSEANTLRKSLKEIGATYKVVKKRLLKLIFQKGKIDIDPKEIEGQIGVVFSPKDLTETSQTVYRFGKENEENFKILGGIEMVEKKILKEEEVNAIGSLPSKDVLIGQLAGMLTVPIKSFLIVLNERGKQVESS